MLYRIFNDLADHTRCKAEQHTCHASIQAIRCELSHPARKSACRVLQPLKSPENPGHSGVSGLLRRVRRLEGAIRSYWLVASLHSCANPAVIGPSFRIARHTMTEILLQTPSSEAFVG